jgi:crotonobetainyl-CoA:carnitine CoA-transferase CaiB-like acyl-CoA transferase
MSKPLHGIRVVEFGTLIAAPFATRILGDFGAEVIKIEEPGQGDPLRRWRKIHNDVSLWSMLQSRNKKSIGLDLKNQQGREIARQLATTADIVVENFRPGALEKFGLGWDHLSALNPKLILVRISGFGQTGPYKERAGFGAIGEAMGGIRYTTGDPTSAPARVGISLGDSLASLHAVIGALMCLLQVKSGGGAGQIVDVSLFESVFNLMESLVPEYDLLGHVRERSGGSLPGISPSNTYRTADGEYVIIAGNSDVIFKRLMRLIGRPDLENDAALSTNDGRVRKSDMLDTAIEQWTSLRSLSEVLQTLEREDVPCCKIYSVRDIVSDPQYQAREMIVDTVLPDGTSVKMPGVVPKLSDTPGSVEWLGPKLGEHTSKILLELGYSNSDVVFLRQAGIVQ